MKTVLKNTKRIFAVFMALAIIVLSLPDSMLTAYADTVARYNAVETTDEDGNPVTEYVQDENGAYVYDEASGTYVAHTESIEENEPGGGDPEEDVLEDPSGAPAGGDISGEEESISISSGVKGLLIKTTVDWDVDAGVKSIKVIQIPTEPGEISEISKGGSYTVANALNLIVTYVDGYKPAENGDSPVTYYTVAGRDPVPLTLADNEGDGIYTLDENLFNGEDSATGKVVFHITSAAKEYAAKVGFDDQKINYTDYKVGSDDAVETVSVAQKAVYDSAITFKAAAKSPAVTLKGIYWGVGIWDALPSSFDEYTKCTVSNGTYTVPKTAVAELEEKLNELDVLIAAKKAEKEAAEAAENAEAAAAAGAAITAAQEEKDATKIWIIPDLNEGIYVDFYPIFLSYNEDGVLTGYNADALSEVALAPDVDLADPSNPTTDELAALAAKYPEAEPINKDLSYTFRVANGYDELLLYVFKDVKNSYEKVAVSTIWDKTTYDDYNTVTIKIAKAAVADASLVWINVKAVEKIFAVNVDARTMDPNLDYSNVSAKAAGGEPYDFIPDPEDGYEYNLKNIQALNEKIKAAIAAKSQKDLIDTGLYAVKKGVTPSNKMSLSQIYPILPVFEDPVNPRGVDHFTIAESLAGTNYINSDITIYTGALATGKEASVVLAGNTAISDTCAEKFGEAGEYGNKANFGKDYKFQIDLKENNRLVKVSYGLGAESEGEYAGGIHTLTPETIDGASWYVIDGEDITDDITIIVDTVAIKTAYAVINAMNEVSAEMVTAVSTAIGDGEKVYHENSMPYVTDDEAIKALPQISGKTSATLETGGVLNIKITLKDSSCRISEPILKSANKDVYNITGITKSGNTYTIKGYMVDAGTAENPAVIQFRVIQKGKVSLTVTDNDASKTVSQSLEVAVYEVDDLAEMTDDEKEYLPHDDDFVSIKSPYALSGLDEDSWVFFRHKKLPEESNYAIEAGGLTPMDVDAQPTPGYVTYNETTVEGGETIEPSINVSLSVEEASEVYVYNNGGTGLTKLTLKTDSANLGTATAVETYKTDYYTNKASTKIGVVKDVYAGNGYRYFPYIPSRTNLDKVDTKNLIFTFTLAGNYTPTIQIGETDCLDFEGVTLKTASGTPYEDLSAADKAKSQNLVLTVPKSLGSLVGNTISFAAEVADGSPITVYTDDVDAGANKVAVTFIKDGKVLAVEKTETATELFVYTHTPKIGDKVTLQVVPAEGYTLAEARLTTKNLLTSKESQKNISVKPAEGFTLTLTDSAVEGNDILLSTVPAGDFSGLTYDVNQKASNGTEKKVIDSKTKQSINTWTYNSLRPGVTYAFGEAKVGGAAAEITDVKYAPALSDVGSSISKDGIKLIGTDIGKTFKLTITAGGKVYENAYTVKAAKPLSGITIQGVKDDVLTQELGTVKEYLITPSAGASLESLDVESAVAELSEETGKLMVYTVYNNSETVDIKINGAVYKTITVIPGESKVNGTVPNITLKNASNLELNTTLALPSAVSSNTLKTLIGDEVDAKEVNLIYKVTLESDAEGADPGEATYYIPVEGATQKHIFSAVSDVIGEENELGGAYDFTVSVQVLLVNDSLHDIEQDEYTPRESAIRAASKVKETVLSTKAVKYPTSIRVTAVNNKLYAGQAYEEDGINNIALTEAELKKSYVTINDVNYYILAKVTLDAAATVTDFTDGAVTTESNDERIEAIAAAAKVIDGLLVVPSEDLEEALALDSSSVTGDLIINAPVQDNTSTPVQAVYPLTLEQRAYWKDENNYNYEAAMTGKAAKKANAALTISLPVAYAVKGSVPETRENLNKWKYRFIPSYYPSLHSEGIKEKDVTIANGKVTVKKDYVLPSSGTATLVVEAISAYNAEECITYTLTLVAAEAAQPQGELVLAWTGGEGKTYLVAKSGQKMTYGEILEYLSDPATCIKPLILKTNAVIERNGLIKNEYIVSDTDFIVTTSNAKLAESGDKVEAYKDSENKTNCLNFTYNATGSLSISAVAENTGAKKNMTLNVIAGTFGKQDGYTITVDGNASSNTADAKCGETAPTVTLSDSAKNTFTVKVKKGTMNEAKTGWEVAPEELKDFYSNAELKAGAGVTIIGRSATDSSPFIDTYEIVMYGKTGKVTLGGKTYTITNTAKTSAVSAGTVSHTPVYGDYGITQRVTFTASGNFDADKVNLSKDENAAEDVLAFMGEERPILPAEKQTGIAVTKDAKGKNTFTLELETDNLHYFRPGTYTFYATFLDEDGDIVTEPQKVSFKVTKAPAFSPKTSYTINLNENEPATLAFTSNNGKDGALVCSVWNANVGGVDNDFKSLFAENDAADGVLTMKANNVLLQLGAESSNRSGYITYTADGGITFKTVKVTLTFAADERVTVAALSNKLDAVASTWSVQNTSVSAAEKYLKTLVDVPSGVTVKVTSLEYSGKDALASEENVSCNMKVKVSKGSASEIIEKTLTIPAYDVTLTKGTGVGGITYTVKDGTNYTMTVPAQKGSYYSESSFKVLNGGILTVTGVKAADGFKPDSYDYNLNGKLVKNAKSGSIAFGQISADSSVAVNAMNTITLTKAANVDKIVAFVGENEVVKASEKTTRSTGNVSCGSNVVIKATNAKGYEVTVEETTTKSALTTDAYTDAAAGVYTEKTYTYSGETPNVMTGVNASRTYAATAKPHNFTITVDTSKADDVYNISSLQVKNGNSWVSAASLTAPFGGTVTFRLKKLQEVDATKAEAWTVTTKQKNVLRDSTASGDYFTYTTEKITLDNLTITTVAQQNAGLTVTNLDKNKAISAMELWKVPVDNDDEPIEGKAEKVCSITSKKQIVIPDPGPTDTTEQKDTYVIRYNVKDGYQDWVAEGEGADEKPNPSGVIKIGGTALLTDGRIYSYTLLTTKSTKVGFTDTKTEVYDPDYVAGSVSTIITAATYTYTVDGDENEETIALSDEAWTTTTELDPSLDQKSITIKATTIDGYDLKLLVYAPGSMSKPTVQAMTLKSTAEDGSKTWEKTVTLRNIAAIGFRPVAQSREIIIYNPYTTSDVSTPVYYVQKAPGVYGTKQTGKSKTPTVSGKFKIKAPYKSVVKVEFGAPRGMEELKMKAMLSDYDGTVSTTTASDYVAFKPTSYTSLISIAGSFNVTYVYGINED